MSTTAEAVDIHDPIYEICARLGIEPKDSLHIDFLPSRVVVMIALLNEHGSKYVNDEGDVATETRAFAVTT